MKTKTLFMFGILLVSLLTITSLVSSEGQWCTDLDSWSDEIRQFDVKGSICINNCDASSFTVNDLWRTAFLTDSCESYETVTEYDCIGNQVVETSYDCNTGDICQAGRCITPESEAVCGNGIIEGPAPQGSTTPPITPMESPRYECTDIDGYDDGGKNHGTKGTICIKDCFSQPTPDPYFPNIWDKSYFGTDFCVNSNILHEYTCENTNIISYDYYCGAGKSCIAGACVITGDTGGEECDDGNLINGDGCNDQCEIEYPEDPFCGDGIVNQDWEECDGPFGVHEGYFCNSNCKEIFAEGCGNNVIEGNEECDDGEMNGEEGYCNLDCTEPNDDPTDPNNKKSNIFTLLTQYCEPLWTCGGWSECNDEVQTRNCEDTNYCEFSYNKPAETIGCDELQILDDEQKTNPVLWFLIAVLIVLILILLILWGL